MNYALIFAGGIGSRLGSEKPKQFIKIFDKPILVHTVVEFNKSPIIDEIVIVTLADYVSAVKKMVVDFNLNKVKCVVSGGTTAVESQFLGLLAISEQASAEDLVFIHDGVRPFINEKLLIDCEKTALQKGNAITISAATETISVIGDTNQIEKIMPRQNCVLARAPQVFRFGDIYNAHLQIGENRNNFVDSASLMMYQGHSLNVVYGPVENIKITTLYELELCRLWMKEMYEKN